MRRTAGGSVPTFELRCTDATSDGVTLRVGRIEGHSPRGDTSEALQLLEEKLARLGRSALEGALLTVLEGGGA